jgi:DNA-binding NarL/FixJ family response regulator
MKQNQSRIFIVDDHPIVWEGLTELFHQFKEFQICGEAGDITAALQGISEAKPDVAIVDLTIGLDSGLRLIENILHDQADMPILVLSMHDEVVHAERCLKTGAKGYLMKKESSKELVSAVRTVLKGKTYVSSNIRKKLMSQYIGRDSTAKEATAGLNNRELEIYMLVGNGLKTSDIGIRLNLSVKTVNFYMGNIRTKMKYESTHELRIQAMKWMGDKLEL